MTHPTIEQVKTQAAAIAARHNLIGVDAQKLFTYEDEQSTPLYWRVAVYCFEPKDKYIRPFHSTGTGFEAKEPPAPPEGKPLYGLQRLAIKPAALVVICEGEKATDALNKYFHLQGYAGALAVTSGGASSATAANWQPLAGRACFVFPDNDDAGIQYAADVVQALQGIASGTAVLDISGLALPHKGDAVEWLAAGGNIDGLMMLIDATRSPSPIVNNQTKQGQGLAGHDERITSAPEVEVLRKVTGKVTPDAPVESATVEAVESEDETIARLATLNPLAYDRIKKATAEALGVSTSALDKAVRLAQRENDGAPDTPFEIVESHPHPIDPAQLLSEVSNTIKRFIILDDEEATAAALWCAQTWFIDVAHVAPLLIINAPEKACGKTQLLTIAGYLSSRPISASNASVSALFRSVELWKPTILIDEADTFFRDNTELHGMVNAGYLRGSSVLRCEAVGDNFEPRLFPVFSPKAMAGIALEKHLPDATMSRGLIISLRRKLATESTERIRHAPAGLFEGIASKLARFRDDYSEAVRVARPHLPETLNDRAQDNWSALLAVASCAGDAWLERATNAALKLSGEKPSDTQSIGNELLADIQAIFEAKKLERISTADLIASLCEDEELSWNTHNRGKPFTPKQLSNRLKSYGITSHQYRASKYENPVRGFNATDFNEVFSRYLSDPLNLPLHVTKPAQVNNDGLPSVTGDNSVTLQNDLPVTKHNPEKIDKGGFVTDIPVTKSLSVTNKPDTYGLCNTVTAVTAKNECIEKEEKEAKSDLVENWGVEL
ncbi:MAG: DUF3631 domain-containing protein [Gallionella sp.]